MDNDTEPGSSRLLFLSIVRLIVEKYDGHLDIDDQNGTFTVNVPESKKANCIRELEEAVGPPQETPEHCDTIH